MGASPFPGQLGWVQAPGSAAGAPAALAKVTDGERSRPLPSSRSPW